MRHDRPKSGSSGIDSVAGSGFFDFRQQAARDELQSCTGWDRFEKGRPGRDEDQWRGLKRRAGFHSRFSLRENTRKRYFRGAKGDTKSTPLGTKTE